ncbi:MAG: cyclic pyranopterin monophosphate synthase MoaC [Thermofilum sp. ex4484_15]|nr:MAG: cyclic pyranopterin monophosphate synthase MoaC [Thermofilum sp. ex4484_15]
MLSKIGNGKVDMVNVSNKGEVHRLAVAVGRIILRPETIKAIKEGKVEKGDVLTIAKLAGILAAKYTPYIIPLCHQIPLTHVDISFKLGENYIEVWVKVEAISRTGVEMEALTSLSVTLLTIWDMVKKYEKDEKGQYPYTKIEEVRVLRKFKEGFKRAED